MERKIPLTQVNLTHPTVIIEELKGQVYFLLTWRQLMVGFLLCEDDD